MTTARVSAVRPVLDDLRRIFGDGLEAVVVYGGASHGPVPSLALVRTLSFDHLQACADRAAAWARAGAATPLILTRLDFERSLDAFPIEYGEIMHSHDVVHGDDPFAGLVVDRGDLRRACEVQVKSHLVHLREDFIESGGRRSEIESLVRDSAPAFVALLRQLTRLDQAPSVAAGDLTRHAQQRMGLDAAVVGDLVSIAESDGMSTVDPVKLFPAYVAALERLADFVDQWRHA